MFECFDCDILCDVAWVVFLCCCSCDCVISLHMLVWFDLLNLCAVLWCVIWLCFVVVECVLFCVMCSCVSFVVYCETLYVFFVCVSGL